MNNNNNNQAVNPLIQQNNENQKPDNNEIIYGVLSYLGFLSLIVLFVIKPKSDFGQFHAKQGSNLFIIELIINIAGGVIKGVLNGLHVPLAGTMISLVSTAIWILSIIGLIYAAQGKKYELPVISKINIFK